MNGSYVIAMDVHRLHIHVVVETPTGQRREERSLPTGIPPLRALIEATPTPRHVVLEEGPLAGWLYRELREVADHVVVAETRRNAYVAKDGDKSDPIDAAKLAQLYRGGFIRPVHHPADARRASFKDLVLFYHKRVSLRVAAANRLTNALAGQGMRIAETGFQKQADREAIVAALPAETMLRFRLEWMLKEYDLAVESEQRSREELERRAMRVKMIRRFAELPGIGPIRAATFYAMIDTPFRFPSKSALWRYAGLGLCRRSSGQGRERVQPPIEYNRLLKDAMMGAAMTATSQCAANPFQDSYRRQIERGLPPQLARRVVARQMAAVMWGMWKSNTSYRADWIGPATNESE